MNPSSSFCVVVPTLNAGAGWKTWLEAYRSQSVRATATIIIDSGSRDETVELARAAGLKVHCIPANEFSHSRTRQLGADLCPPCDVIVFLTQDAILADERALEELVLCFDDPKIAAAYGRQLPSPGASAIAAHARYFNYPALSENKDLASVSRLGIKSVFISNSFAAFRRDRFEEIGGLRFDTIMCEDAVLSARLLLAGHAVRYCAESRVHHSHEYTTTAEFRRYFDIGVFHCREPWLPETFGNASSEGLRFVKSEISYLWKNDPAAIPGSLVRAAMKLLGYQAGLKERRMPLSIKRACSMHRQFWNTAVKESISAEELAGSSPANKVLTSDD
jgi:rhamnosyltransferase